MKMITVLPHEFDALLTLDAVMLNPEPRAESSEPDAAPALPRFHRPWPTRQGSAGSTEGAA